MPLFLLCLEHSCLDDDGYYHTESVDGGDCCACKDGVCDSVVESVLENLPDVRDFPRLAHVVLIFSDDRFVPDTKLIQNVLLGSETMVELYPIW